MIFRSFVALATFYSVSNLFAFCQLEFLQFKHLEGGRSLSQMNSLNIGSYNVLNLEFSPGIYKNNPTTGVREYVPQKLTKDSKQTQGVANIIKQENLDIVVLQEVEGREALKLFNHKYLENKYEIIFQKGNDSRGIEIAYLIKKDLPFKYKITTNKHSPRVDDQSNEIENLFSRDLPALHIWKSSATAADDPDFVLLGNHLKSQRDRKGDPKSVGLRTEQVNEIVRITKSYETAYPDTPVFLTGDFNANISTGVEFKPLFKDGLFADSFDLTPIPLTSEQRITHSFHPRNGKTKYSQLDAFLTNKNGRNAINDARVYRYKKDGNELPLPKTFDERAQNPSDHYPIIIRLNPQELFN